MLNLVSYSGTLVTDGIPYITTVAVAQHGVTFRVCNIGSNQLNGDVVVSWMALG